MKNYDKLKQIICEVNSEILYYTNEQYALQSLAEYFHNKGDEHSLSVVNSYCGKSGRPIRLADCTKAIIDSKRWKAQGVKDQAKDFFNLSMYWICDGDEDNLETKEDKTKQFLIDLLI